MPHSQPAPDVSVDVLDVSDLRFSGGTSGSVAEEVKAQSAAGYSTGLLHLHGPLVARTSPVNPALRRCVDQGLAELVLPRQRVRAKAVVVRHPAVLQHAEADLAGVETDRLVVVANAAPVDIDRYQHYTVDGVREAAARLFGAEPLWAPIGPLVRDSLAGHLAGHRVTDEDWVNIIDVDAWAAPRTRWLSDRPVIGRHSRDNPQKWPADAATLRAVYPADGSVRVRVLGGAAPAEQLLGGLPGTWDVLPFGAMSPREFLAGIDFFVYFHNPRWVEAFGRTILEALASGAVAILPPHFSVVFGDAAVYAEPDQVRGVIERLYSDRAAYEQQAARGQRLARERFGHEAHAARLERLIGPPAGDASAAGRAPSAGDTSVAGDASAGGTTQSRPEGPAQRSVPPPSRDGTVNVLLVSSNGSGMGHLTRLLAYAERAGAGVRPHFLSLSQAVPVVGGFGYPYEYLPSMTATGLAPGRWQAYFERRVTEAIERLRPAAVVFDGTVPYEQIPVIRQAHPDVRWAWSRRGMWYPGHNREQLAKAAWFDLVVEPGDLAAAADRGVTASAPAMRVGPVTLLDRADLDDRAAARRALGLDPDRPAALVTLGAGNVGDTVGLTRMVLDPLRALGAQICVTRPEIANRAGASDEDVHRVGEYPLSRRYAAFDVAVSAAGYNSFHELMRFGVPTLFLPNLDTSLDDQRARARYAASQGWAYSVDRPEPHTVDKLIGELMEHGAAMVAGVAAADPGNGAAAAMAAVEELVEGSAVRSR